MQQRYGTTGRLARMLENTEFFGPGPICYSPPSHRNFGLRVPWMGTHSAEAGFAVARLDLHEAWPPLFRRRHRQHGFQGTWGRKAAVMKVTTANATSHGMAYSLRKSGYHTGRDGVGLAASGRA